MNLQINNGCAGPSPYYILREPPLVDAEHQVTDVRLAVVDEDKQFDYIVSVLWYFAVQIHGKLLPRTATVTENCDLYWIFLFASTVITLEK